jgi:hypothetical protein
MPSLRDLPVELLDKLYGYLEVDELLALCKSFGGLDDEALEHIGNRHFGKLELLATSDSLSALTSVADHPLLCKSVREVWITPVLFELIAFQSREVVTVEEFDTFFRRKVLGESTTSVMSGYPRRVTSEARHRFQHYLDAVADHRNLVERPELARILERAFAKLPNLKEVGLKHHTQPWQDTTKIKCRGWKALYSKFGFDPTTSSFHAKQHRCISKAAVFEAILMSAAKTDKGLHRLTTCEGECCGLLACQSRLSDTEWEFVLNSPVLASLTDLHLCIRMYEKAETMYSRMVQIVTKASPNLEALVFSQKPRQDPVEIHGAPNFLLLAVRQFKDMAENVHFNKLKDLRLFVVRPSLGGLKQFLRSGANTLQKLELERIVLCVSSAEETERAKARRRRYSIPSEYHDKEREKEERVAGHGVSLAMWNDMLHFIGDNLRCLTYLKLALLQTEYTDHELGQGTGFLEFVETYNTGVPADESRFTCGFTTVVFHADFIKIPLDDWIDQLRFRGFEGEAPAAYFRVVPEDFP